MGRVPSRSLELVGRRFGRLTVRSVVRAESGIRCDCVCDCGAEKLVGCNKLRDGVIKSCGCYRSEFIASRNTTHNSAYSEDYNLWSHIKQRCENPKNNQYKNYGGRGISMCDRWRTSFGNFIADMGSRPSLNHSIERIDNDGNYEPSNCKWILKSDQHKNTRTNHHLEIEGVSRILADWVRHSGTPRHIIARRLGRGWSAKDAVYTPIDMRFSHRN